MTPPDETGGDALFTDLLAVYGDALAAGQSPDPDSDPAVPPGLRPRLRRALDCLRRIRGARPATPLPATVPDGVALPPSAGLPGAAGRREVGRFRLERVLGHGGFGVVFLALDTLLGRHVALKVPRLEAMLSPQLRQRFLREGRAAAALDHPNLVRVLEAGEADGLCYLVSAYCPGSTLADWLKRQAGPVPPRTAAALVATLADAVQYVHEHGLWHRDVKPSNVLLDPVPSACGLPFTPRLTDFGLALPAECREQTRSVAVGTPAYMAPEQTGGRVAELGPHTDVYGLGALLYEVLTGRPPFQAETEAETLRQVRADEPVPPRALRPDVPPDLETVCLKCLRKGPRQRYASAAELAGRLRLYLEGRPVPERPPGWVARLWRGVRRWPRLSTAAALLALALAVGLGAGYHLHPERPRWELSASLRQGRTAVFAGDERLPGPFRQVLGDAATLQPDLAEKCFSAQTVGAGLWELTADPQCDSYRLSAEVRHENTNEASFVGLYFGYREGRRDDGGREVGFATFTFADFGKQAVLTQGGDGLPVSRALVRMHLQREHVPRSFNANTALTPGVGFLPACAVGLTPQWRRLAVEVRPAGVTTFWGGEGGVMERAEEVPADQFARYLRELQATGPTPPAAPADYRPRSGVGLYVFGAKASFRQVQVRPLGKSS